MQEYNTDRSPSGVIHAHTVLSIDAHPDNSLELHIKVLKSRVEIRKYEWRIWCADASMRKVKKPGSRKKGAAAVDAGASEAMRARTEWMRTFDEWCERFLPARLFSRFNVRKPAQFLDEIMGLEKDEDEEDEHDPDHPTHIVVAGQNSAQGHAARKPSPQPTPSKRIMHNLESYLDKRSPGLLSLWQRRWFVLMEDEDMIVYFKSREEYISGSEPVGSFQIADLNTVEAVGDSAGARELHIETMSAPDMNAQAASAKKRDLKAKDGANAGMFSGAQIPAAVSVRTYKLRAPDQETRDQWVAQLKERIAAKHRASLARRTVRSLSRSSLDGMDPARRTRGMSAVTPLSPFLLPSPSGGGSSNGNGAMSRAGASRARPRLNSPSGGAIAEDAEDAEGVAGGADGSVSSRNSFSALPQYEGNDPQLQQSRARSSSVAGVVAPSPVHAAAPSPTSDPSRSPHHHRQRSASHAPALSYPQPQPQPSSPASTSASLQKLLASSDDVKLDVP